LFISTQPFFKEAAGWKYLIHLNVLPFLGASIKSPTLLLVSPWMDNGNINEYARSNPHANRLDLVRSPDAWPESMV
jgi:hypothetical protein